MTEIVREIPIQFPGDDAHCNVIADQLTAAGFRELARQLRLAIKEQAKPAEPVDYGSVILARAGEHEKRERWCSPTSEPGWYSESGAWVASFSMLTDVEVLRVGLGDDGEAFSKGWDAGLGELRKYVVQIASSAITSERKDAYKNALDRITQLLERS